MLKRLLCGSKRYLFLGGAVARACAPLALVLALLACVGLASAYASPAEDLAQVRLHVDAASAALANGDAATARAEFTAFDDGWFDVEDGVKAQSRSSYRAIEAAMDAVVATLAADPLDAGAASSALAALANECDKFIAGDTAPAAATTMLARNQ